MEPIRVTSGHFRQTGFYVAACVLAVTAAFAQSQDPAGNATLGTVQGYVRDSGDRPLANATVFLQPASGTGIPPAQIQITHADSAGAYRFAALPEGAYTLRAEMRGYEPTIIGPVSLAAKETKKIDLALVSTKSSGAAAQTPEFFDEPQFTVAGVTQATNSGGHGSDTVLRTTEALARATVSLSKEPGSKEPAAGSKSPPATTESFLLKAVALNPKDAALHHRLADVEEELGHPLEAVREYQRAAELDPSELYLFDWGTELLTHRALEPATEVFTTGNRLFPKSVRMLVALGVAWYARGSCDQAAERLVSASDLDPDNPTPYLFLGRMQTVEITALEGSVERLGRFAQLQPDNALANYYYAVSLSKQPSGSEGSDTERSARVEALLEKAVQLDPKLGAAYLQLGILYSQRADFTRAISAYQKAIEVSPKEVGPQFDQTLEESHYRLAQAYQRTGDKAKAQEELELHRQLAKKTKEDAERKRREIQQFVISLRDKNSASQPQN